MVRGAFSNMPNSPTRTRVYTVNFVRPWAPIEFSSRSMIATGPYIGDEDWIIPGSGGTGLGIDPTMFNQRIVLPANYPRYGGGVLIWVGGASSLEARRHLSREVPKDHERSWGPWERLGAYREMELFGVIGQTITIQVRYRPTGEIRTYTFTIVRDSR